METTSLTLVVQTPQSLRALLEGDAAFLNAFGRAPAAGLSEFFQVMSEDDLVRIEALAGLDPWTPGRWLIHRTDNVVIGTCGYKGPPDQDGVVEIAYAVAPSYRNRGYATEAAIALTQHAFLSGDVTTVRAYTLPEANASTTVLEKCGYRKVAELVDPEDGLVWRWEKTASPA